MTDNFKDQTFSLSTKTKLPARATKAAIRIFASICIALSGLLLFSDKVLNVSFTNNFGFKDTQTFLWVFTQSISPLLLILGAVFKPYKISYIVPVYMYAVQLVWVFRYDLKFDDVLLQTYAIGAVFGFVTLALFINFILNKNKSISESKISFLEQALDLSVTLNKSNK